MAEWWNAPAAKWVHVVHLVVDSRSQPMWIYFHKAQTVPELLINSLSVNSSHITYWIGEWHSFWILKLRPTEAQEWAMQIYFNYYIYWFWAKNLSTFVSFPWKLETHTAIFLIVHIFLSTPGLKECLLRKWRNLLKMIKWMNYYSRISYAWRETK